MPKYTPASGQESTSDVQPWGLEFLRFDQLLKAADELAMNVRMYDVNSIQQYWVVLYQLYMMMQPYMASGTQQYFRKLNPRAKKEFDDWEEDRNNGVKEVPKDLIKTMTYYHESILRCKHYIGLGIPMSQNFDTKHKMKNALLGKS